VETPNGENGFTLRIFILLLFTLILFIGIASSYYVIENSNWSGIDKTLADTMKLSYVYMSLLGVCLFVALVWLVIDERKIGKLTEGLKEKREEVN
jgi:uncharacterized BrkB/YihY/UPF0761 family membrane protein